jgi:hypothetical protein
MNSGKEMSAAKHVHNNERPVWDNKDFYIMLRVLEMLSSIKHLNNGLVERGISHRIGQVRGDPCVLTLFYHESILNSQWCGHLRSNHMGYSLLLTGQ